MSGTSNFTEFLMKRLKTMSFLNRELVLVFYLKKIFAQEDIKIIGKTKHAIRMLETKLNNRKMKTK